MPAQFVSRILLAVQYDGANAADVVDAVNLITVGNVWTADAETEYGLDLVESQPSTRATARWVCPLGHWLIIDRATGILEILSDAVKQARYRTFGQVTDRAAEQLADDPAFLQAVGAKLVASNAFLLAVVRSPQFTQAHTAAHSAVPPGK